ncbi:hypothetical protein HBB16_05690 [Pseudonocardia sp. MCCB 268]|nr:hypothetical protein [Pseudonocardia cytotoxica]
MRIAGAAGEHDRGRRAGRLHALLVVSLFAPGAGIDPWLAPAGHRRRDAGAVGGGAPFHGWCRWCR